MATLNAIANKKPRPGNKYIVKEDLECADMISHLPCPDDRNNEHNDNKQNTVSVLSHSHSGSSVIKDIESMVCGQMGYSQGDQGSVDYDGLKDMVERLDEQGLKETDVLSLDIGGDRFNIRRSFLLRLPNTRLGRLARCCTMEEAQQFCDIAYMDTLPIEYFFDRNSDNFSSILDIYRTNNFHLSSIGCALVLKKDLEYWGIDELLMEPCCALKYYPEIEICVNEKEGDLKVKAREKEKAEEENFGNTTMGQIRSWLWNVLEYPWTSRLAQFMAFFSLGMVVVSTLTFIISTMDEFQKETATEEFMPFIIIIEYVDTFVIVFFTLEYFLRFICAPRKWNFFKNPMNMVDIFAIIPFYLAIFLHQLEDIQIIGKAGKIVRLIRVMRILRIFKLVRHFAGLQSLFFTLKQAYKELGLLMLLVAVAILTFSSLVYFAEKEAYPDSYNSTEPLPVSSWTFVESFWWGLMTITTVGYDLSPSTYMGKLVGGLCALSGIFILTLPIPIVVNSFASYYKNRLWRNEVATKKRERALAQAAELKAMQKFNMFKQMAAAPMPGAANNLTIPNKVMKNAAAKAAANIH